MEHQDEYKISGEDIIKRIKELIHEGNVRRIIIRNEEGKDIIEIPVTIAVVGAAFAPVLAAAGAIAGVLTKCTLVVIRKE